MSVLSPAQPHYTITPPRNENRAWHDDSNLSLTVKVDADRKRVFQALTLPEYMEAWIVMPETECRRNITVSTAPETFRIDTVEDHDAHSGITGTYLTRKRSKLHFTWKRGSSPEPSVSTVTIRLEGDFERTKLTLIHADLDLKEHDWHRLFWQESLLKLSSLFVSARNTCGHGAKNHSTRGNLL